jgi:NAD(P)-dependent dehydrogenase (short-subunit alcohol dehydrogenase family)
LWERFSTAIYSIGQTLSDVSYELSGINSVERYIPLNRYGKVEDVAPMFLFLAGDAASFITGQVFVIDGGQLAGQKPGAELLAKMAI